MTDSDDRPSYPVHVDLQFHITDGERVGTMTYTHGAGQLTLDDQMASIIEKVSTSLPDGFRLMNRAESMMYYLREVKGYRGPNMVIPAHGKWYDPNTDVDYSDLNNEQEEDDEE